MSRLLRTFLASEALPAKAGHAVTAQRFQEFLSKPGGASPGDMAAAATLLAKRPTIAGELLGDNSATPCLLRAVAVVALPQLASFGPKETVELIHALSCAPEGSGVRGVVRAGLRSVAASGAVVENVAHLEGRGVALVANAYAQLHLHDAAVMRSLARRCADLDRAGPRAGSEFDATAAAAMAHAFAKLQTYHHALFSVLKTRLAGAAEQLKAGEVAQCLFAFARLLPPSSKTQTLTYAFDAARGFGRVLDALLARLRSCLRESPDVLPRETALLALRALHILQLRDEALLADVVASLPWPRLPPNELCVALQVAAGLEFVTSACARPHPLRLPGLGAASPQQSCLLVSALALLQYAPPRPQLDAGAHGATPGSSFAPTFAFPWRWDACAARAWLRLLGSAAATALGEATSARSGAYGGEAPETGRSAAPRVALACLVLLPPAGFRLTDHLALADARQLVRFARYMLSPTALIAGASGLETSEMQSSVELSLRRLAIADNGVESRLPTAHGEVSVPPFWVDFVI
eukprot:CAMPEP_0117482288 /NCGR_PEP_ID=MMETSP0784-20121206/13342_1 /TAXON_ID=39447 /ORGANISM="" /LENGTH=523 /DNA_ID=CAMNT_0005276779 /DNA_START=107 /DNA_END=1675 /DNA_ORIENTATION=+